MEINKTSLHRNSCHFDTLKKIRTISWSCLPFNRRPDTDLLSKGIVSDKKVINIIERGLSLEQNEYEPAVNEWWTGKRSDVVLKPKSEALPDVIVEIQNTITNDSMLTLIDYCRASQKATKLPPKVIVFNTNTISKSVASLLKGSNIEGCKSYPCEPWAECCLIFSRSFVKDTSRSNLNQFTALGVFLGGRGPIISTATV